MWGNARGAANLSPSHPLASLLFQTTGPTPIPVSSTKWTSLLLHYPLLAHLDPQSNVLVQTVCHAAARHAVATSNIAALTIHVTRMINDVTESMMVNNTEAAEGRGKEELVGKVRATCGALNLLRVLSHCVIAAVCEGPKTLETQGDEEEEVVHLGVTDVLGEVFCYRGENGESTPTSQALLSALISFLTQCQPSPSLQLVYDATTLSLSLTLVLLSTQLYQPMVSSLQLQQTTTPLPPNTQLSYNFFLDQILHLNNANAATQLTNVILTWFVTRPTAPVHSLARHHARLTLELVASRGALPRKEDGLYDRHDVVVAATTLFNNNKEDHDANHKNNNYNNHLNDGEFKESLLVGATKGVLTLSSALILLPFRLVRLAMSTIGLISDNTHNQNHIHSLGQKRDVLWLSDSPVTDMGACVLLLLTHNHRATKPNTDKTNAYHQALSRLKDVRWDHNDNVNNDTNDNDNTPININTNPSSTLHRHSDITAVSINFETLFETFGRTLHNELGALMLYTLLQSSKTFANTIAVRSDLDTLVLPLVRTLYFASVVAPPTPTTNPNSNSNKLNNYDKDCHPFRSHSQLYVVLILLLLLSQDNSFGPDAFKRVTIPSLPWYQERQLKDISLGSVLLLTLLRSITYNIHRLHDQFLMSNCCAILLNLAPHAVDLHSYAAMRLAGVTVSCMKRYLVLKAESDKREGKDKETQSKQEEGKENEKDTDTDKDKVILEMFAEASRTLLQILNLCLRMEHIEKNLQVLYALVYLKRDFDEIVSSPNSPFKQSEIGFLSALLNHTDTIIQKDSETTLTAIQAMEHLANSVDTLKTAMRTSSMFQDDITDLPQDFTFTYEEEVDPEVFFVPYIWDVVTCAVTVSFLEWEKPSIKVYATGQQGEREGMLSVTATENSYSTDVINVV